MQLAGRAKRYFRDILAGAISIFPRLAGPTSPLFLCSGRTKTRPRLPGVSGTAQIEFSDLRKRNSKFLILVVIYSVERVGKASVGEYRCSGLGLMFSSIQAMNTAGLCHSGQAVMPRPP